MKLPRLSGKKLIKILSDVGFQPVRQKGSHVIMIKEIDGNKFHTVVPLHDEIDRGTLLEIIRQCRMKRDEFMKLL